VKTYAEQTLNRAVAVLGDVRADDQDREHAALVIGTLLRNACAYPTEADLADLFSALGQGTNVYLAIRRVLDGVQRLRPDTVVEKAGRGVERLMDRAYRDGEYEALCELLLVVLEDERWKRLLRDEWGKAAVAWAINRLPNRYPLLLVVSGWINATGGVPRWMGEIAEAHPDLVTSPRLPREIRWTLHRAAPTVTGWKSLASALEWTPTIDPAPFGHEADIAMTTLEVAIGESTDESAKLRLRLWLGAMTGTTP